MKIIIVGCGKVGFNEGHDITVIDRDGTKLRALTDSLDVMEVEGNGAVYQVQAEAGIQDTDLLIATTNSDELNMLCCLIAKKAAHYRKNPKSRIFSGAVLYPRRAESLYGN